MLSANETRWRLQQIYMENHSAIKSYLCYVEDPTSIDPNTGQPARFECIQPPNSTTMYNVPAQYQNSSPQDYSHSVRDND